MQDQDLAFVATQDLIAELISRNSFCGVVIHSAEEQRSEEWPAERIFRVHYSESLNRKRTGRLLQTLANYLDMTPG